MAKRVHGYGLVARSDGDNTDCGAGGDPNKHILAEKEKDVTCKKCLQVAHARRRKVLLVGKLYK